MRASFSELLARFNRERERFVEGLVHPVLIWEPRGSGGLRVWESTAAGPVHTPVGGAFETTVFEVVKSGRNTLEQGITLGRTEHNDLTLVDDSVSRLHAIFLADAAGWTITDALSKNGTWVDGERLVPNRLYRLQDGAKLKVGKAELEFQLGSTFAARFAALLPKPRVA
ncbi:MAG: FHA domain-containing protein [Myxococcota bacterium]